MSNATFKNAVSFQAGTVDPTAITGTAATLSGVNAFTAANNEFGGNLVAYTFGCTNFKVNANAAVGRVLTCTDGITGDGGWQAPQVTLTGTQTFEGVNTFSGNVILSSGVQISTGATSGYVLTADGSGNGSWQAAADGDVTLDGTNAFNGTNSFNVSLPTSTVTPSSDDELITKSYADDTYAASLGAVTLAGANPFTGTNTFNTNLPTSTQTPSSGTQLITKTYADDTYASASNVGRLTGINDWEGLNTFDVSLPTSIQMPSNDNQLITKEFSDLTYGALEGTQTFEGVNTFSGNTIFSSGVQISTGATNSYVLTSDASGNATWQIPEVTLLGSQSFSGVNTFSTKPVFSAATTPLQITTGATNSYVLTSDASGNATWQIPEVTLIGSQSFSGVNTFSTKPVFSAATTPLQITTGATNGYVLTSDASGNATWQAASGGGVTLAGANPWTGTNTFNTNLPTSTQTPSSNTQLVTKVFTDSTYLQKPTASPVTWTGTWNTPQPFTCYYSNPLISSSNTIGNPLLTVNLLITSNPELFLTSLDFGTAQAFTGLNMSISPLITSISGSNITAMFGNINITAAPLLTTLSFPNLGYSTGGILGTYNALTSISFPALTFLGGLFGITATSLTSISFPLLTSVAGFSSAVAACTSIDVSSLQYVVGTIAIQAASLTTFNLPALVYVSTTIAPVMANLTSFSIGSTLKFVGGNVTMTGMKLDQASVDNILVRLAALDGTNGTTAYSSKTVAITGGTSSTPSATGLAAKATLVGRGCTVTNN